MLFCGELLCGVFGVECVVVGVIVCFVCCEGVLVWGVIGGCEFGVFGLCVLCVGGGCVSACA